MAILKSTLSNLTKRDKIIWICGTIIAEIGLLMMWFSEQLSQLFTNITNKDVEVVGFCIIGLTCCIVVLLSLQGEPRSNLGSKVK